MPSDEKPSLTPRLRFPEFRDGPGWETKELHTIAEPVSERAENEDENNILTLSGEHGLVLQSEYFGKQIAGTKSDRYLKIQRDDFVYNDRTTKASAYGTIKRLTKYPHGIVSPIYKCFRFKEGELPGFWEWYFESGAHELQLRSLANEGARAGRFNVSIDRFLSTSVWTPDSASNEQQKIAECLSAMDEVIEAESQKLNALQAHKKWLMQQLFPREAETLPRLRFPEFQNAREWQPKRLSSEIDLISGMHLSPEQYGTTGEVPYFTGPSDFTNDIHNVTKWGKRSANIALPEDTLITVKGSGVGEVWYSTLPAVAMGRQLMAVRSKHRSSSFVYQFLLTKRARFETLGSGNLIPGLSRTDILDLESHFPSPPEQHRIATCLCSLDDLIAAQSEKIQGLKTHKQGLMQQLFPSRVESEA
jgi:type I restriction enzyme, S subunit